MTRTAFRISDWKRATMAAVTSALLVCGLSAVPAAAGAAPAGTPAPLGADPESTVDPTFDLKTRVVADGSAEPGNRLEVEVGNKTHRSPAGSWSCPTGVWVLELERKSLEVEASDSYPLCSEADTKVLAETLKTVSSERTVIVNSLNQAPGGDARTLKGLGKALAPIGVPADEFAAVNLAQTSFSVYGIPGLSAGQGHWAKGALTEEASVATGSPTEASINGTLALDNHSKFTLTMPDYVLYDIAANGAIELHGHTYPVPDKPANFKGGFHLLVVDRRSLEPVTDTLYSTNDNPAGQYRMINDLNRLAANRGQAVLVFMATVGEPIGGRQLPVGPANLPAQCTGSAAFTVTCTYKPVAAEQRFTVPAEVAGYSVTNLHVTLQGGFGGYAKSGGEGGDPDRVIADLPVGADKAIKPGQTLYVEVAGNGTSGGNVPGGRGGWNGGADGGDGYSSFHTGWPGGGGGGASDIRTVSRAGGNSPTSLDSRIVVAGGGGGAGGDSHDAGRGGDGGDAGSGGGDGRPGSNGRPGGDGGDAGTSTRGGDGGAGNKPGLPGTLGDGGAGRDIWAASGSPGGGGGGYFGGGGGGTSITGSYDKDFGGGGGGGGGSNLVPAGGTVQPVTRHEPASVSISYQVPYGTLAQALRPFGATPSLINALDSSPRYALAGMLNTPAAAAIGLSADAPEASPKISAGATGRLQGVLQRGRQNMWYDSITSNAPVVRSLNGDEQDPTVTNYGLYRVISKADEPWPVPVADPGPVRDAQLAALIYLSRETCNCDDIRNQYNSGQTVIDGWRREMEAMPFPSGQNLDQAAFDTVKTQLVKELGYVHVVGGLEEGMHTVLSDQEHMFQPALLKAYADVREAIKVPHSSEVLVPIIGFILELFKSVAEGAEAHGITAALGIVNASLRLSTELTNGEGGEDADVLETTADQLGQETAETFAVALNNLSQTFGYLYEDWGKLSEVADGLLRHKQEWNVSTKNAGKFVTAARDAVKLSYYRALVGVTYQRFEAQAAPTSEMDDWCVWERERPDIQCETASFFEFGAPSSAYTTPVGAPALDFRSAHDNILVTVDTADSRRPHPLSPELMKEMTEAGLYAPYLFLRWSMVKGATCPADFRMHLYFDDAGTGTIAQCVKNRPGVGSPGLPPHPTATPNRVFQDAAGDARKGVDIRTVKVWNRRGQNAFHATLKGRHFAPKRAEVAEFYLDVNRQRRGPEFVVRSWSNQDDDGLTGARLFQIRSDNRWLPGKRIACKGLRVSWRVPLADEVRVGVLKKCVGGAGAFAVHARLWEVKDYKTRDRWAGWRDVAPKPHTTYAWVKPEGKA
jgi:hypothetical protein